MRNTFRHLPIIIYINIVLLCGYMFMVGMAILNYIRADNFNWVLLLNIPFILTLFIHTLITLNIYKKHYPDKELSVQQIRWAKVVRIFTWIVVSCMYIGMLGLLVQIVNSPQLINGIYAIFLTGFYLLAILMTIQLVSGARLIRKINNNYRQFMQDSFSDNPNITYERS